MIGVSGHQARLAASVAKPSKGRLLIIEDNATISNQIAEPLREKGYFVQQCFDGNNGLAVAKNEGFHLLLLDIILPGMDGLTLLGELRRQSDVPVIIISAKSTENDRIAGFKMGADDYLPKPFNAEELQLRIDAILKRTQRCAETIINSMSENVTLAGLTLDCALKIIEFNGQSLNLTNIETKLLSELIQHQGQVLTKAYLYNELMGRPYSRDERSLDVHVSKLRRKLNLIGFRVKHIRTVYGQGYCLK